MLPKKGRKKTHKFNSEDFKKLSTEERRLRGKISTLRRMIKKRESEIEELMKPILKKRKEIKKIQTELSEITETFKNSNYNFPKFRVEGYTIVKGKDENGDDKFLKIVKNITSKGFVRSNYEEKLVDLSDVRINLTTKN